MPHFTVSATTQLDPTQVRDALTDFGPHRPELWPNLATEFYRLHRLGATDAEVTEGSRFLGGVWERLRYDWSSPNVVRLEVLEGNATRAGSYWEYRIEPLDSGSRVELELDRRGRGLRGVLLTIQLSFFGKRVFASDLRHAFDRIAQAPQATSRTAA